MLFYSRIRMILRRILGKNKLLFVVLVMAAILRFVGTNPGYNQYHADEGITYSAATSMIKNGNLDPLRYDYPALVPLINYIFFKFVFIPIWWGKYLLAHISQVLDGTLHLPISDLEAKRIFQLFILGERERNALFWGRYVTALFSLGNVFLTYFLGKRLFNKNIGLIAAFLLTFNYKHVINSHIGLPDIYNAFFVLASIISAVNLWHKPTKLNYLLAGIVSGLSFSIKYQFFSFIPIIAVHIGKTYENFKVNKNLRFGFNIVLTGLVAILLFFLINPYHFINLDKTVEMFITISQKYAMGTKQLNLYPFSYFFHIDYGLIEFTLMFLGILLASIKFPKQTLLLMSVVAPFFYVINYFSNGGFYIRNFITTTPLLMLFTGVVIGQIFNWLKKVLRKSLAISGLILILVVVVFIPAKNSIINSYYYTKPWGYDIMKPWIEKNLPKDVIVAAHPFDASNLNITNKRTEFDQSRAYSLAEHRENGASYAIIDLDWAGQNFYFWMGYGFNNLKYFWNKPLDMMRNTYWGIAMEELFRYQVYAVTKPWQAPDHHLIVSRFYFWPSKIMQEIKHFNFNEDINGWTTYGNDKSDGIKYVFDGNVGHSEKGSVLYLPGATRFPGVRLTSEPIPTKVGHLYKVSGYLKTDLKLESSQRDGFIRIDFYGDSPNLNKVGIISSVSSRVYGTSDWIKKEVSERAPTGSKYMTTSFQTNNPVVTKIWLDDVSVEESTEEVKDITKDPPYNVEKIDLNYVYPNSHGNL